jgi:hypothetical protein
VLKRDGEKKEKKREDNFRQFPYSHFRAIRVCTSTRVHIFGKMIKRRTLIISLSLCPSHTHLYVIVMMMMEFPFPFVINNIEVLIAFFCGWTEKERPTPFIFYYISFFLLFWGCPLLLVVVVIVRVVSCRGKTYIYVEGGHGREAIILRLYLFITLYHQYQQKKKKFYYYYLSFIFL